MKLERLILGVTYRCQCRCVHCSQGSYPVDPKGELTFEEIRRVVEAASEHKLKELNLFGGEALLREDIFDILHAVRDKTQYLTLDSNGVRITEDIARKLKQARLSLLYMSLFSADPEFNEQMHRRKGVFDEIMESTDILVNEGIPLFYSTCIFREHLKDGRLEELIALAKRKKVNGIRLLYPLASGSWFDNNDILLTEEEKAAVNRYVDNRFVFVSEGMNLPDFEGCPAISGGSLFISPYGEVQPCNFVPVYLGNIREEPLEIILDRAKRHHFFTPRHQQARCPMMTPEFLRMIEQGMDPQSHLYPLGDFQKIEFHTGCTNGCPECQSRSESMGPDIRSQLDALWNTETLHYSDIWLRGGEPFLHPEAFYVLEEITQHGYNACAVSNARIFATLERAEKAARAGLREVHVPVWGQTPEEYDAYVRIENGHKHMLAGIKRLSERNVTVVAYVDPDNRDFPNLLLKAGVDRVVYYRLHDLFYCDRLKDFGRMEVPGALIQETKKKTPKLLVPLRKSP